MGTATLELSKKGAATVLDNGLTEVATAATGRWGREEYGKKDGTERRNTRWRQHSQPWELDGV
jgi:hypothetical protein